MMMAKRDGEMDVRKAANLLGLKRKTVRTWARKAWDGQPTALAYGRKDGSGQWFVREAEVRQVADEKAAREKRIAVQSLPDKLAYTG
jgi:hypothetical protein